MSNLNPLPRMAFLIALLMVMPTLMTATPAGANTPAIVEAMNEAGVRPGSDFKLLPENAKFYLHNTDYFLAASNPNPDQIPSEPGGGTPASSAIALGQAFVMDLGRPTDTGTGQNSRGIAMGPAVRPGTEVIGQVPIVGTPSVAVEAREQPRFDMTPGLFARDELRLFDISAKIYVGNLNPGTDALPNRVFMDVYAYTATGERGDDPFTIVTLRREGDAAVTSGSVISGSANPGPVSVYGGSVAFDGINGLAHEAGMTYSVQFRLENGAAVLWADTTAFPSAITVRADSARIAMWTEDRRQTVRDVFPPGVAAAAADRVVNVVAAHFNVWGALDCAAEPTASSRVGDCAVDNLDQAQHRIRIYKMKIDPVSGLKVRDGLIPLDQGGLSQGTEAQCCTESDRIKYNRVTPTAAVFRYAFPYGTGFEDGLYKIELYQPPGNPNNWIVEREFRTGLVAFSINAAPGEVLTGGKVTHSVLAGEETHFTVRVANSGAAVDTISVAVPPPAKTGWTASTNAASLVLGPGEHRDVTIIVKSPATAPTGETVELAVSAVSSLDQTLKTLSLVTKVAATDIPGVTLSSTKSQMEVRPNQVSAAAITIRNDGFKRTSFVISKVLVGSSTGGNCADWVFTVEPPSIALYSSSRADLLVSVTPPVSTVPGTACVATFQATKVGDANVKSTLTLPIKVLVVNDVNLVSYTSNERTWRYPGEDKYLGATGVPIVGALQGAQLGVIVDEAHDKTATYRLQITNAGDQKDVYQLRGSWNPNVGTHTANCEGQESSNFPYDGVPNGWGYAVPATGEVSPAGTYGSNSVLAATKAAAFSGVYNLKDYEVNPGETIYVPLELGTSMHANGGGDACPKITGIQVPSREAEFSVTIRSALDQTVTKRIDLKAFMVAAGDFQRKNLYTGSLHDVHLEMGLRDGRVASDVGLFTREGTSLDIKFPLRLVNKGNELGQPTLSVESGYDGWTHTVEVVSTVHGGNQCSPNNSAEVDTRSVRCTAGVYDEIIANVVLTPPADVPLGERHSVQVIGSVPGQESSVSVSKRLTARVVGTYDFQVTTASALQQVAFGQKVRLPFTIENLGTQGDNFQIQVADSQRVAGWNPSLSLTNVFVPALARWHGYVEVQPPAGILADAPPTQFQVLVTSTSQLTSKVVTVSAKAIPATADFFVFGDPVDNLLRRGEPTSIFLKVNDLTGRTSVNVTSVSGLPSGWVLTAVKNQQLPLEEGTARAEFKVTAPSDALGTSRLPLRFRAVAGNLSQQTDVMINLASSYGVGIATPEENATLIQPGSHANFVLEVTNRGLSQDTIEMTGVVGLPNGWSATFSPTSIPLQPLESRDVTLTVNAPATAPAGQFLELVAFANSLGDNTRGASAPIRVEVGRLELVISSVTNPVYAAPESKPGHTLLLKNNGTLTLKSLVLTSNGGTYNDQIDASFTTAQFAELLPGEVRETRLNFQLPPDIRQRASVPVDVVASSTLDVLKDFSATHTTRTVLLPYAERDVDRDGFPEYAVDANRDSRDGREAFAESSSTTGVKTVCLSCSGGGEPPLARFLTTEARAAKMVDVTSNNVTSKRLVYLTDASDDGAIDLFLDTAGDQLPDRYWDSNRTVFQDMARATLANKVLSLPKDVTGDGILDYFLDTDGDGLNANGVYDFAVGTLDVFFDLTTGKFGKLIPKDINGDNIMDYVVDLNGNERVDNNEPVLFASAGRLASLLLADVDGDGTLDEVFTYEGRGPNCFIRKGVGADGRCIPITLKDVNRDGKEDWTYDIDGDGRIESYYDPVSGESGKIDTQGQFVQSLREYWYVSALFLVVTVLFVVLLAVTRR